MAVLASFIGINKYRDDHIRELSGARRDATALWALFSDSIPGIQARLLVDDQATKDSIRSALQETLGAAGPEDTVIVSFAGHGSRSHRLLAHDTDASQVAKTSLSMGELGDLFCATQARFVLILLDCCFSGGATARVFEDDEPIPRDIEMPLDVLVEGRGRILISAANTNEAAYEHPVTRHGLFTKALLDALCAFSDVINVQAAMSAVMDRVRAESARLGVTQTPMLYQGLVEGGMTLPPLRPGPIFAQAFPELYGARVGGAIKELAAFGLPEPVLRAWADRFLTGLNSLQQQAINDYRVLDGRSLLIVAPTSSGKTMIGEMAAVCAITEGRKAVFLLPYKALTSEKYDQFDALYGTELGLRVIRCTGDYVDQATAFARGKYDLACMTYEMFLSLAVSNPTTLSQIGLVVLDEAQFVCEPKRGIIVELLLTFLIAARELGIQPQIVALSAVIGDLNSFHEWLGCEALVTDRRPVKLVEGVLDHDGVCQFQDEEGNSQVKQLVPRQNIHQRRKEPSAQDVIVPLVRQLMNDAHHKVIIFRNMRSKSVSCAKYLAEGQEAGGVGLPAATEVIAQLPATDQSTDSTALRECLRGGTAFHNTNLNREERSLVERAYRDPQSKVRVLSATTTVAAGINTPASVVILADHRFVGEDERDYTVAEYRNMAGRAGRLGFQEEGQSLLYAENAYQRDALFRKYVQGHPEPLKSSFEVEAVETWALRLLAQVARVSRDQITTLLASTFGGFQAIRRHPEWKATLAGRLNILLDEMLTWGLVEQDGAFVQLTPIGRACGRSTLAYSSCVRLIQLLRTISPDSLTHERLMALVQNLPESDGGYTPTLKGSKKEAFCPQWAAVRYGRDIVTLYQQRAQEGDYIKRCKRACILADWIDGVNMDEIESRYTSNQWFGATSHGDIRRFADNTRYHLRAAHEVACLVHIVVPANAQDVDMLLKQLEVGIPAAALGLLNLPLTLTRGEYMSLMREGITTAEQVLAVANERLAQIVGMERATEIQKSHQ